MSEGIETQILNQSLSSSYHNAVHNSINNTTYSRNNPKRFVPSDILTHTSTISLPNNFNHAPATPPADLFHQGDAFLSAGFIHKAFIAYSNAIAHSGQSLSQRRLTLIIKVLQQMYNEKNMASNKTISSKNKDSKSKMLLTCYLCKSIFTNPVSYFCGHTFCEYCSEGFSSCLKCGASRQITDTECSLKTNLLIFKVIDKLPGHWKYTNTLKKNAISHYRSNSFSECISLVNEGLSKGQSKHIILCKIIKEQYESQCPIDY